MKRIPLTQGKFAIVDDADFDWLNQWKWHVNRNYAVRWITVGKKKQHKLLMHRIIMNTPDGYETDHINGNKLDNRRCNLRVCTKAENQRNQRHQKRLTTSRYKGVYWNIASQSWRAQIGVDGQRVFIGRFNSEVEAALAYNEAATKYFGDYALLNKVEGQLMLF